MEQTYSLDAVIRRVDSTVQANPETQCIIAVNTKKKEVVEINWKTRLLGNMEYYLVSNTVDSRNVAQCKGPVCTVRDSKSLGTLDIRVIYDVQCPQGEEKKAVVALFDGNSPQAVLDEKIQRWVSQFHTDNDLIQNYQAVQLEDHLKQIAKSETGLWPRFSPTRMW